MTNFTETMDKYTSPNRSVDKTLQGCHCNSYTCNLMLLLDLISSPITLQGEKSKCDTRLAQPLQVSILGYNSIMYDGMNYSILAITTG